MTPAQALPLFRAYLVREEKSDATIEKYLRDAACFVRFLGTREITRELTLDYKHHLQRTYALRSVNSMLASLNSYLSFLGLSHFRVKNLRCQRQTYCSRDKQLTKEEYIRLLSAARGKESLHLILQTLCATGIRVSELSYFTVEGVKAGQISVRCKSKTRLILIPRKLQKQLLHFARRQKIDSGVIFRSRNGSPLHRSCIWRQMKKLCKEAGVQPGKVFPHNLRKLFARTFYRQEKDIAKLADILGHSSINTTRIYIMSTGEDHLRRLERLGLVV